MSGCDELRSRVEFLQRAHSKLTESWRQMSADRAAVVELIGGLHGLTLPAAVAAKLGKLTSRLQRYEYADIQRAEQKRERALTQPRGRRPDGRTIALEMDYRRDTGVITDELFAELITGVSLQKENA